MATTKWSSSANEERKEMRKAVVKNLVWIGIYLTFLFLAGVDFKQRYDWPHTWWYLFVSSLGGTLAILIVCQRLRKRGGFYYYGEEYKQYIKCCVLLRAASLVSVALLVYSALVVTLGLKILGTAFTVLLLIILFLRFFNYLKRASKNCYTQIRE